VLDVEALGVRKRRFVGGEGTAGSGERWRWGGGNKVYTYIFFSSEEGQGYEGGTDSTRVEKNGGGVGCGGKRTIHIGPSHIEVYIVLGQKKYQLPRKKKGCYHDRSQNGLRPKGHSLYVGIKEEGNKN